MMELPIVFQVNHGKSLASQGGYTPVENNISVKTQLWVDDFPFPMMGYVSCLEGTETNQKVMLIVWNSKEHEEEEFLG